MHQEETVFDSILAIQTPLICWYIYSLFRYLGLRYIYGIHSLLLIALYRFWIYHYIHLFTLFNAHQFFITTWVYPLPTLKISRLYICVPRWRNQNVFQEIWGSAIQKVLKRFGSLFKIIFFTTCQMLYNGL